MTITAQTMKDRRTARQVANTVMEMIKGELPDSKDAELHFLRCLAEGLGVDPANPDVAPPSFDKLKRTRIDFGQYAGEPLEEIPPEYLDWLLGKTEETLSLLRNYFDHPDKK